MHARAGVSPATRSSEQAEQRACELATPVPRTAAPHRVLAACTHDELPLFLSFAFGAVATVCGAVQCGVCVVGGWGLGRGRYGATAAREAGSSAVHLGLTPRKQLALQVWCKDFPCLSVTRRGGRALFFPSRAAGSLAGATQ